MTTQNPDFLLIGQGLAGSVLSYHLLQSGASVRVINASRGRASASRVAAGLYNPITGRKMVKTWRADELFPYLESFYPALEQRLGASFFHPLPIYRPFVSAQEQNEWAVQADNTTFAPYVRQVALRSRYGRYVHDERGGLLLRQSGYVDVPALLRAYRTWLRRQELYEEAVFDPAQLVIGERHVRYGKWQAPRIVFCDGARGAHSSFFDWLPFRPVKGEIMRIKTAEELPIVFNRGVFVIPQGQYSKVGSTYDHHDLSEHPTDRGRQTLQKKLDQLLTLDYEVTEQWAGVRPATQDRRPLIGTHPEHEPLAVFNGFGSKGVSLIPFFAQHFVHCLSNNQAVDETVNIRRFYPASLPRS